MMTGRKRKAFGKEKSVWCDEKPSEKEYTTNKEVAEKIKL